MALPRGINDHVNGSAAGPRTLQQEDATDGWENCDGAGSGPLEPGRAASERRADL